MNIFAGQVEIKCLLCLIYCLIRDTKNLKIILFYFNYTDNLMCTGRHWSYLWYMVSSGLGKPLTLE